MCWLKSWLAFSHASTDAGSVGRSRLLITCHPPPALATAAAEGDASSVDQEAMKEAINSDSDSDNTIKPAIGKIYKHIKFKKHMN